MEIGEKIGVYNLMMQYQGGPRYSGGGGGVVSGIAETDLPGRWIAETGCPMSDSLPECTS